MVVESASRMTIRRPNSVIVKDDSIELYMAFESKEEKDHWIGMMNQVCRSCCA